MAFMPEDVLNKNFTATQFRRGYDEQEVDDFLDEVVVELRRLSSDGDDLRTQLKACQESKGIAVPTGAAANGNPKVAQLEAKVAQLEAAAVSMSAAGRGAQDKMVNAGSGAEKGERAGPLALPGPRRAPSRLRRTRPLALPGPRRAPSRSRRRQPLALPRPRRAPSRSRHGQPSG